MIRSPCEVTLHTTLLLPSPHPHFPDQSEILLGNLGSCWTFRSGLSLLQLAGDNSPFVGAAPTFLPLGVLLQSRLQRYSNSGLCGRRSTLQPSWHHSWPGRTRAPTKVLAVLTVLEVPVSGLSLRTASSAGLWKTSGLLPLPFIIPKVRLIKAAPALRPPAIKVEQ